MHMHARSCAFLVVLACGLASISAQTNNVFEIVRDSNDHAFLETFLTSTDLVTTLISTASNFTVFAPTDTAFGKLPTEMSTCFNRVGNKPLKANLLKFHVVSGRMLSSALTNGQVITPMSSFAFNNEYTFTTAGRKLTASSESAITTIDLLATNGVVHVIDSVLVPTGYVCRNNIAEVVANSDAHSILFSLVGAAGLADLLSGYTRLFTLFAPNNNAISALAPAMRDKFTTGTDDQKAQWKPLLSEILKFHVLEASSIVMAADRPAAPTSYATLNAGDSLMVSTSGITSGSGSMSRTAAVMAPDLIAGNGVVHSIDRVLLPVEATRTVATIAVDSDAHTKLVELLTAADLVDTLSAVAGAFTVFAPTDDAFDDVDEATLTCLLEEANKPLLVELLKYHVHAGVVLAAGITGGSVEEEDNSVPEQRRANDAAMEVLASIAAGTFFTKNVPKADISTTSAVDQLASNGVVHVVDKVLIPVDFACPGVTVAADVPGPASTFSASSVMAACFLAAAAAFQARF